MVANFPGANVAVPGVYGPAGNFISVKDMGHLPIKHSDIPNNRNLIKRDEVGLITYLTKCSKCESELKVIVEGENIIDTHQYMRWIHVDNDIEKPQHCDVLRMESAIG